ncbi:hypothetical protein GCM10009087_52150 [Sphingomonas oligophenolica]|uniref:Lipoprotein n=1 Tax=Sphingomonas oligophenolica TaxID=301154 RepID=A0ABU9Y740_9SPHN
MARELTGIVVAASLALSGCRWSDRASAPDPADRPATRNATGMLTQRKASEAAPHVTKIAAKSAGPSSASVATAESSQTLRFPYSTEDKKKWVIYSESEEGDGKHKEYKFAGDSYSKYYTVVTDMSDGDQSSWIENDRHNAAGDSGRYADYVGIRKSRDKAFVFFYYLPDDESLGSYDIVRIEGGRALIRSCTIKQVTLEIAAGKHFKTKKQLIAARFGIAPLALDLLTSAEPDLKRDDCLDEHD